MYQGTRVVSAVRIEEVAISGAKCEHHPTGVGGTVVAWVAVLIQQAQVFNRSGSVITGPLGQERLTVDEGSLDL